MTVTLNVDAADPLYKKKADHIGKSKKFSVSSFDSSEFEGLLYFLRIHRLKSETELD